MLPLFEPMVSTLVFTARLNKLDVIKIKLPSEAELKGITEGNKKVYNERIEDRLFCKVFNFMMHLMVVVF